MNRDTALCLKLSTARQSGIRNGFAAACAQARRWYAVYHQRRALAVKAVLDSELRKLAHSLEGMVKIDHGFGENAPVITRPKAITTPDGERLMSWFTDRNRPTLNRLPCRNRHGEHPRYAQLGSPDAGAYQPCHKSNSANGRKCNNINERFFSFFSGLA